MSAKSECSCKTVIRPGQFHKHGCPVEPSPPPPGAAAPDDYPYLPEKRPGLAGAPRPKGQPSDVERLSAEVSALRAQLAAAQQTPAPRLVEGQLVRDRRTGQVGEYLGAVATIRTRWDVIGGNRASHEAVVDPDDLEPAPPGAVMGAFCPANQPEAR